MRPPSGTADGGRFGELRLTLPCITTGHLSLSRKSLDFARCQQKNAHRKECEE